MMYKIENKKLIEAPVIYKGIIGYNNDLQRLIADGWKPLIITGEGENIEYIEHADHIEEHHTVPPYDYKKAREEAYPSLGDMIDAFCKAYAGDDTELKSLMAQRDVIKATIKKTKDAN